MEVWVRGGDDKVGGMCPYYAEHRGGGLLSGGEGVGTNWACS